MISRIRKIVSVLSVAVLCAVFIVVMYFCAPEIDAVPDAQGELSRTTYSRLPDGTITVEIEKYTAGEDFAAVRVSDLGNLKKLTEVNYVPDKFVQPNSLQADIQIVDLTKPFEFAEKGTLIFVIMNLDADDDNFYSEAEKLDEYKIGDYWHFTLSLPKFFSASNVYCQANLVARHGEIENYDFIDFNTSYDKKTETFSAETEPTLVDLNFYTKRETIAHSYLSAQFVTVHYQSQGSAYSGISECPLIGTESAVKNVKNTSQNLLIAFAILAAVVFSVFVVLSILERSKEFVSAIVWVFGIFAMLLARFLLSGATSVPLFWTAVSLATSFVILGGAILGLGADFRKIPLRYIFSGLSAIGALLAFICPFVPFGAANALTVALKVIKGICAASLLAFVGFAAFRKSDTRNVLQIACAAIIAVAVAASLFTEQVFPAHTNPMFWLSAVVTVVTFIDVFYVFMNMKKSNAYLTSNLHREVDRQVKDIKAVIAERDKLLQYVSHDMRKPLVSSESLIETLINREKDDEQIKALRIVKQHTSRVISNLSEIAVYAKFNYIAEPSKVVELSELLRKLYEFHLPDCNANGIILKNSADKRVKAFVKPKGLENVVSNLIINAVEHANCSTITLSVKTDKNKVLLYVSDDGKGIDESLDVFKPYVSENETETGGVGLYICKNVIESMNGELTYETGRGGTVFRIALLKA